MIEIRRHYDHRTETYRLREQTPRGKGHYRWGYNSSYGLLTEPTALDLLDIGKAILMADRAFRRSDLLGSQARRLSLRIPVRSVRAWSEAAKLLEDIASFVSADRWHIEFTKLEGAPNRGHKRDRSITRQTAVALFSGGLDSLCGAAYLYSNGYSPIFVTHSPPGSERVRNLLHHLANDLGKSELAKETKFVSFRLTLHERNELGVRVMFQEPTRRTRPLFFLTLAGAVALDKGIETIQMSENGALAVNIPIRADAYGARCARQAHAEALRKFELLLRTVCPWLHGLRVMNPFVDITKGEASRLLGTAKTLASRTESCEYTGKQAATIRAWKRQHRKVGAMIGTGPQCGLCIPCIVRRAALKQAGIRDLNSAYFFDARRLSPEQIGKQDLGRVPLYRFVFHNVFYMLRFCARIRDMSFREFVIQYFPELRLAINNDDQFAKECVRIYELQRRFASEVEQFLKG